MKHVTIVTTEKESGKRLEAGPAQGGEAGTGTILVNPDKLKQEIFGFGGAFTMSAAAALNKLSPESYRSALEAYYHPENGIGYNMGRIHMGCCDFSFEEYSHNDVPGDRAMENFGIQLDKQWTIPMIQDTIKASGQELLFYAVPWSPPAWMKSNGSMNEGGRLREDCYDAMALYFIKFLQAYRENGIPIWAVGAQNEPDEVQRWASCIYSGIEEGRFLKNHLLPALERYGLAGTKILIWDSNKDKLPARVDEVLADPVLRQSVAGAAFHWYSGDYFENLDKVHRDYPETLLFSTESCVVLPEDQNDWSIGERYGHELIGDFNHWANGFIDWNLFLDTDGGPNIHNNFCAAPILVDTEHNRLIYMSSYYYIGHFSKFIRRGARRIACETQAEGLEAAAFHNPGGQLAVVVMNAADAPCRPVLQVGEETLALPINGHSIQTVLIG